jgi:hypothetical protein
MGRQQAVGGRRRNEQLDVACGHVEMGRRRARLRECSLAS